MTYATTRESWGGPRRHGGGASVLSASVPRAVVAGMLVRVYGVQKAAGAGVSL